MGSRALLGPVRRSGWKLNIYHIIRSNAIRSNAGIRQNMSLRRSARLRAKRRCASPEGEEEAPAAAAEREVPAMTLHPRDSHFEDLEACNEYPHRFHIRAEDPVDQVQWTEETEEGKEALHEPVPHFLSSQHSKDMCFLRVSNNTPHRVRILWLDYNGNEVAYGIIEPQEITLQQTFFTHPWVVRELTTCTRLLLNGQEAFVPSEQQHQRQQQGQQGRAAEANVAAAANSEQGQQQQGAVQGAVLAAAQGQQQGVLQMHQGGPGGGVASVPLLHVQINELPELAWTKETHACFPAWFKSGIKTFLMCHEKLQQELVAPAAAAAAASASAAAVIEDTHLGHIPALLLPHITAMAAPVVPQGVHFPAAARTGIKPALLSEQPTPPAGQQQEL